MPAHAAGEPSDERRCAQQRYEAAYTGEPQREIGAGKNGPASQSRASGHAAAGARDTGGSDEHAEQLATCADGHPLHQRPGSGGNTTPEHDRRQQNGHPRQRISENEWVDGTGY
jgi:hypothetical protein